MVRPTYVLQPPRPDPRTPPHPYTSPLKAFKNLDKDGSGSISVDELSGALKQFGIYDDAAKLLDSADKDKVGQ